MAATTISRASLTDGVTIWNAATVGSAIYDKIDDVLAGAAIFGGVLGSEGFGAHLFSAGGTGVNYLVVRNTTSGSANYAGLAVGNNTTATLGTLWAMTSGFASGALNVASGVTLQSSGAGGLSIAATDANGDLRFFAGGADETGRFGAVNRCLQVGYGVWLKGSYDQTITGTQTLDSGGQYYAVIRLTSCTSTPKISSMTAGNDGDLKIIVNVSGASCTVQHNGGGPTTRIYMANATDGTLGDDESMMLLYDAGSSSWIEVGPR